MHCGMNQLTLNRWILTPVTSWRAWRLSRTTDLTFSAAWVKVRTATYPDEVLYALRLPGERDGQ